MSLQITFGGYQLDDDRDRIDFAAVHRWIAGSYWSPGIPRQSVEKAARFSSLVVGAYHGPVQTGYLRVVSDRVRFAWLADVYVDAPHRKQGVARAMVNYALTHPDHQNIRRWALSTKDAHNLYASLGFKPLSNPDDWMTIRRES